MTKTEDRFFLRLIMLALPIIGQNLLIFFCNFQAGVVTGSLGDSAISGYFLGNQLQLLLQIAEGGIEATMVTLASQYLGRGDRRGARRVISVAILLATALSLAATLICHLFPRAVLSLFSSDSEALGAGAEYLRILSLSFIPFTLSRIFIACEKCSERSLVGLFSSLISLAVNLTLCRLLVFGGELFALQIEPLGIVGAAVAFLVSYSVELLFSSILFFFDRKLGFNLGDLFRQNRGIFLDFVKYGLPIMAAQAIWAINTFAASAIMGRINEAGVLAGFSIAGSINTLSYTLINGLSGALAVIIGKAVLSKSREKIKHYTVLSQFMFLAVGVITGLLLWVFKDAFISLWGASEAARGYAREFIGVLSLTIIGTAYQLPMLSGVVRGGGDVSFVMKSDAVFVLLIVLPLAFLAKSLAAPAAVVFFFLKCDHLLKCPVAFVKVNRFGWIRNLTDGTADVGEKGTDTTCKR